MKGFTDLSVFAAFLNARAVEAHEAAQHALGHGAAIIRDEARMRIGSYQDGVGPFNGWDSLAEATQRQRERQGYAPDDPLLRAGSLRSAISSEQKGNDAAAGVKHGQSGIDGQDLAMIATVMELGSARVPARPYLGPAGFVKGEDVAKIVGQAVSDSLAGKK